MSEPREIVESCHHRLAVVIGAIRAGLTDDSTVGAMEILQAVQRDLATAGMEMDQ